MRVVVPPVLVEDRICRIIAAVESLLEVEEWAGAWWQPSGVPLTLVSTAVVASPELLRARGVPECDIATADMRPPQIELEALMRGLDPQRPADMRFDEETVARAPQSKPRAYPGNSRFRRHTPSPGTAAVKPAQPTT